MIEDTAYAPALLIGGAGALWDVRSRTLPNPLCLALVVASVAALGIVGGTGAVLWGLAHAAIALAAGVGLFALGWIGGGDAKFYAAAAAGVPLSHAPAMLAWTALGGLVLLTLISAGRLVRGERVLATATWSVPYGVAIYIGFCASVWIGGG